MAKCKIYKTIAGNEPFVWESFDTLPEAKKYLKSLAQAELEQRYHNQKLSDVLLSHGWVYSYDNFEYKIVLTPLPRAEFNKRIRAK